MANIRREFGDDLTLKNGNLGINTTTAQERVDVVGVVKGTDLNVTGVSSLTAYEGFLRADNQIVEETNLEFGNGLKASLSGEIIVGTGVTVTIGAVGLGTTSVGVGTHTIQNNIETTDINLAGGSQIECLKVYNTFTPPSGGTNERPYKPKPGELYYNYDFKTIEFFDGYGWRQVDNTTRSGRAVIAQGNGGPSPANIATMEYVNLNSKGNGQNFGDAQEANNAGIGGCSDGTRGVWTNTHSSPVSHIQYTTITSGGGSINFGSMNEINYRGAGHSSSTRGLWMSGRKSPGSAIVSCQTIQIQTTGNSIDFGDAAAARRGHDSGMGSPTRAFMLGGYDNSNYTNDTQFKSIASGGDMVFGGDLVYTGGYIAGCSNSIRGFGTGGYQHPGGAGYFATNINSIDLASAGNAVNFGDLTQKGSYAVSAATQTRAFRFGGIQFNPAEVYISRIEDWSTTSSGNATEFGDLTQGKYDQAQMSDSHGGLGGF